MNRRYCDLKLYIKDQIITLQSHYQSLFGTLNRMKSLLAFYQQLCFISYDKSKCLLRKGPVANKKIVGNYSAFQNGIHKTKCQQRSMWWSSQSSKGRKKTTSAPTSGLQRQETSVMSVHQRSLKLPGNIGWEDLRELCISKKPHAITGTAYAISKQREQNRGLTKRFI